MKTPNFLRPKARLGLLVIAAWVIWPFVGILLDYVIRLSASTTRKCSIEGCTFDLGVLDIILVFGLPLVLTFVWWRRRRINAEREEKAN